MSFKVPSEPNHSTIQIGEISLNVVRIDLPKDCEMLGSNGVERVTETKPSSY